MTPGGNQIAQLRGREFAFLTRHGRLPDHLVLFQTERISEAPTRVLRFDPRPTMTLFTGS
jgi:hypothetical protein